MAYDFSDMNKAISATFASEFTYFVTATGQSFTVKAIEQTGDRFTQQYQGAIAGLFVIGSDLPKEPTSGDEVQVPTGRYLKPGFYRIVDVIRNGNDGRLLLLQYIRK